VFARFCCCPLLLPARDTGAGVATLTVLTAGAQKDLAIAGQCMNVDAGFHVLTIWQHETALASQVSANTPLRPACAASGPIPRDTRPLLPAPKRRRTVPGACSQYSLQPQAGGGRPLTLRKAPCGDRLHLTGPHWIHFSQHHSGAVPLGQPPSLNNGRRPSPHGGL